MKTNPEEFVGEKGFAYSKWGSLISAYKQHLETEDQETLTNALDSLLQQAFTEKVLEELVDPKEGKLKELLQAKLKNTPLAGATQKPSMVEHITAHIEAIQKHPEFKTTVGKLHNYT
jgi:hypothetical protein